MAFFPKSKLKEMAEAGISVPAMAAEFRRTPSSIARRLAEMGLSKPQGRPSKLDKVKLDEVLTRINLKVLSVDDGASQLGVSKRTLQRKLKTWRCARSSRT